MMLSLSDQEEFDDELMTGRFDEKIDEFVALITSRPQTAMDDPSQSNTKDYNASVDDKESSSKLSNIDDLLCELDTNIQVGRPTTSKRTRGQHLFTQEDEYRENQKGGGFFNQTKFCSALRNEMKHIFNVDVTIEKSNDGSHQEYPIYIVTFQSTNAENVSKAKNALKLLFDSVKIEIVGEEAGFWIQDQDYARIVQFYGDQNKSLLILCEYSTIGLFIHYFDAHISVDFHRLCTTRETLRTILKNKFKSSDVNLPASSDVTKENKSFFAQDILQLEVEVRTRPILMKLEQRCIHLFGINQIVDEVVQQIECIKERYASNMVQLNLDSFQINYLIDFYSDEFQLMERTFVNAKILEHLKNGEFMAPQHIQSTIERQIKELATFCPPSSFTVEEEAFRPIAHNECPNLIKIGRRYKCHVEIEEFLTKHICEIPRSTAEDHVSNKLTAAAIKIEQGDLADQKVDLVVICSTSLYLRDDIIRKAGQSVKEEYEQIAQLSPSEPFETNSGDLQCRKLLFLPWHIDQSNKHKFTQSIRNFVRRSVQHALRAHHTSIAFPSIGCGKLNIGKDIIANEMLVEAQNQLLTANTLLQIIFVILPQQMDVVKAFEEKLASLQEGNIETKDAEISYHLSTLTLTIHSSNENNQRECIEALHTHVTNSTRTYEVYQQTALKKWTQPALNKFFRFCQKSHVVIDVDMKIGYLRLYGSKEAVREAESEYLRQQVKQSEEARLAVIARDIIWAYKIGENQWEKYSSDINALIEDQYTSKLQSFDYTDDKSKEYLIDFQTMTEKCLSTNRERPIVRQTDFTFPKDWHVQIHNVQQFSLPTNSDEFKSILRLFNKTMTKKYTEIVRIDRIQNKQWYMQYNSYRNFSPKKHTERKLFHGCSQQTTSLIINSFFNRSFAGINGIVYGQGAYFSAKANYSHNYATMTGSTGERYMFVADVLVGDTITGNSKMKTPPTGYDSTTDGDHIFVTYRDDQAYASYMIVYK
ncbi:unnamed protein product [Adineta ricciae]|uniref:Poly [ADP-ribose] polymerase n=1 Tax=Adineta ricciae TaxID=249248 RepID=A0A814YIA9_ADIRI|nr:unnamed protein product [Adineta ricciae]